MTPTAAPSLREQLALALALDNSRLFAAVLVLSLAPLWMGRYLPMIDLPQHAAQIGALREIWSGNEAMGALFRVNWFTPYLLGYLLLYALALVMPITVATQAPRFRCGRRNTAADGPTASGRRRRRTLEVAGYSVQLRLRVLLGFLSFIVAAPLALLFLIRTIGFVKQPSLRNAVSIALFAIVLFFCHVIVLGFASLVALGYVVGVHHAQSEGIGAPRAAIYGTAAVDRRVVGGHL